MTPILGNALLQGEHVYFDAVTKADIPRITAMWQDIGYQRLLSRRMSEPATEPDMESWYLGKHDSADPTFAIRTRDERQLIGTCGFKDIRWQSRHAFFWIGVGDPAARGRGYGSDATRVLLKYGFLEMNLNCIGAEVLGYNDTAYRTYERVGFQYDGKVRAYIYRDGTYYDMHLLSITRDEWEARYGEAARLPLHENNA